MGPFQYLLLLLTGLAWTAESMEMLLLSFLKQPLQCAWGISDAQAALITTAVGVGMLAGALFWGVVADSTGRRWSFILSTAVTFFLGVASALSPNYLAMLLLRGAVGFGIGGVPVSFSLLMEFLPVSHRGTWGMAISVFWSIGAIFESAVAMAVLPPLGWRWLIGISSLPLGIVLLLTFIVLESPRWLVSRGRLESAKAVVERVATFNGRTPLQGSLVAAAQHAERPKGGVKQLLRPGVRWFTVLVFVIWFASAFLYYGTIMVQPEMIAAEKAGTRCVADGVDRCARFSDQSVCQLHHRCVWKPTNGTDQNANATKGVCETVSSGRQLVRKSDDEQDDVERRKKLACVHQLTTQDFLSTLWASVGELPGVLLSFAVLDSIGRRALIGDSFFLVAVLFAVLLLCVGRVGETVIFFIARGASSGYFQGTYLYTNEVYPARVRATAMGVCSSVARVGLILTPLVAQLLFNRSIKAAMGTYAAVSAVAVVAVKLIPIETTGWKLQEHMEQMLALLNVNVEDHERRHNSFAHDPKVWTVVRWLRWNARIDAGLVESVEHGTDDEEDGDVF